MKTSVPRRSFLRATAATGAFIGLGDLGFLSRLPRVSAAETRLDKKLVSFRSEIEPLVRLLENTPRERLLEEVAARVKRGVTYREIVAALLLAGVRNIEPRPVGFKFHAVLVVNSAHLASQNSPDSDRWLPIFWALDQFKASQARNRQEGDWRLGPVDEAALPAPDKAWDAFAEAMDGWNESAADTATAALARDAAAPQQILDLFCSYGARDFRDIGHKAIYVANSWRVLQTIGWQHAEPVLRSLAYALLDHEGSNPASRDVEADRPGRHNLKLLHEFPASWMAGKPDPNAIKIMLSTLREASWKPACEQIVALLKRGIAPQSLWDAHFSAAGELVMRKPGIVALHAVTSTNALHYSFQHAANDQTRRFLLLQSAAFLSLFRQEINAENGPKIDELEIAKPASDGKAIEEIFADVARNKDSAARKTLAWLSTGGDARPFIAAAQRLIYLKGNNSHDYKFSSALLEDYFNLSPNVRDRFLAAGTYLLKGSTAPDNDLVARTRAALSTG
jgi:hypothetical protein